MNARAASFDAEPPGTSSERARSDGLMSGLEITTPTLLSVEAAAREPATSSDDRHAPANRAPADRAAQNKALLAGHDRAARNEEPSPLPPHGLPAPEDDQSSVFRFAPVTIQPVKDWHKVLGLEHENRRRYVSAQQRLASDPGTDRTQLSLASPPSLRVELARSRAARRRVLRQTDRIRSLFVGLGALVVGAFAAWFAFGDADEAPSSTHAGRATETRENQRKSGRVPSAGNPTSTAGSVPSMEAMLTEEQAERADLANGSEPKPEKKRKRKKRTRRAESTATPGSPTSGDAAPSPPTEDSKQETPARPAPIFKWGEG